jgi:DNA-directed RNA polymerase specialized sigma24 family protein
MRLRRVQRKGTLLDAELPALERSLRTFLRRKLPSRAADHDDLVADTIARLWEMRNRRDDLREFPSDAVQLRALARVILRHRIADLFRNEARAWAERSAEDVDNVASNEPAQEAQLMIDRMLRIVTRILANGDPKDRELLRMRRGPMGASDRKRLERLRTRLSQAIEVELGVDAKRLLREGS